MTTPLLGLPNTFRGHVPTQTALKKIVEILDDKFGIPAVAASMTGTFTGTGTDGDDITVGDITYALVDALSEGPTIPNEVLIGQSAGETAGNFVAAIVGEGEGGEGVQFSEGTEPHPDVTAEQESADVVITAKVAGAAGNEIVLDENGTGFSWAGEATVLAGGSDISDTAAALAALEEQVGNIVLLPSFEAPGDNGKVLKIVDGELAWAADETSA